MIKPDIPDFTVEQCCGSGAYGDVWTALDRNGIRRAVKALNITRLRNLGVLRREEKAIELFRTKVPKHPNLVEIYHVGETENFLYYVMELADDLSHDNQVYISDTLEARLKERGASKQQDVITLINSLLNAVEALHQAGLVHRDIKPSNIIYANGVLKLADIGLTASDSTSLSVAGTPAFIPPEKTTGAEADLYAMGKLLYCTFTGYSPDKFPSLPEAFNKSKEIKGFEHLNKVALKACAKNPSERFKSAEEFRAALGGCRKALRVRSNILKEVVSAAVFPIIAISGTLYLKWHNKKSNIENAERSQLMNLADLEFQRMHPTVALIYLDKIKSRWPEWTTKSEEYFRLRDNALNLKQKADDGGGDNASRALFQAAVYLKDDPEKSLEIMKNLWLKDILSHKRAAMTAMYAKALESNKKYDKALEIINLSTKLKDPAEADSGYLRRSDFYLNRKEYDKALNDVNRLIEKHPNDRMYLFSRYNIYLHMKQYEKGLSDLKRILNITPDDTDIKELIENVKKEMLNQKALAH